MLININLLPAKKKKKSFVLIILILTALLVIASAGTFFAFRTKSSELERTQRELSSTIQLRETLEAAAGGRFEKSAKQLSEAVRWSENASFPMSAVLFRFIEPLPERVFFHSLAHIKDETFHLTIQFDSSRAGANYLNELKAFSWVQSARILSVTTTVNGTKEIPTAEKPDSYYLVKYEMILNQQPVKAALAEEDKQ